MKKILVITVIVCAGILLLKQNTPAVTADENIQARVALEASLESRLKNVITEIIGSDKLIVIVNVQLRTEKEEKSLKNIVEKKKEEATIILPGVPVRGDFQAKKEELPLLAPLTFSETKTSIQKIQSIILIDKSIDETVLPIIQQIAAGLLGIDSNRGDKLEVKRISFRGSIYNWKDLIKPPEIFIVGALALGLFIFVFGFMFAFGPLRGFFANFINAMNAQAQKSEEGPSSTKQEMQNIRSGGGFGSLGGGMGSSGGFLGGGAGGPRPFSFVNESHTGDLIYLMKKAPPEAVAVLVNYINPVLSARVISSLDEETQNKVTALLSNIQEFSKENIKELEEKLKSKLDYMVGGEERLTNLIAYFDKETQFKVLEQVRKNNSTMADKIRKTIFTFESIVSLEPKIVQMIIRNINPSVFAQVLKSMDADFQRKIFGVLPEGQAERLQQEMQLAKPLTKKRIDDEKRVIVNLVKSFEQQGIIELNR